MSALEIGKKDGKLSSMLNSRELMVCIIQQESVCPKAKPEESERALESESQ